MVEYSMSFQGVKEKRNRRMIVRNVIPPERSILTDIGSIRVKQPSIQDKRVGKVFFTSTIQQSDLFFYDI